MAGFIRREDVALVREQTRIDEIVSQFVTLRPAGVGSLKGLCPFHDEKTPSFHVRPQLGHWHCFGCAEGGDVISFIQKINHLPFAEAVEYLAGKAGVTLRYEESGGRRVRAEETGTRQRLAEAGRLAEAYFREQYASPEAAIARRFMEARGFDSGAAERFAVGYAPKGWENLARQLRSKGFTEAELTASGLVSPGQRGVYDRFRGRLIFPIRDLTGITVGFGARRLHEDDEGPKYLNTPETALYKKSQVLYGLDLARKAIATGKQVVVVEGYTDVMAMHLAGVPTAIASCGTAFGADHIRVVRRLLGDMGDQATGVTFSSGVTRGGEVIFTFDGDEAGQKAALRAFDEDQRFAAQTFVAVEPGGLDPCDLRLQRGDTALRSLVSSRVPLFEFAVRSALARFDLRTAEGRIAGLRAAAPVVARIRDRALAAEYSRALAGWLGMPEVEVRRAVGGAARGGEGGAEAPRTRPRQSDPVVEIERHALTIALQLPRLASELGFDELAEGAFIVPVHQAVFEAIRAAGGVGRPSGGAPGEWLAAVSEGAAEQVARHISALAVEPPPVAREEAVRAWASGILGSLRRTSLTREIAELRGRLQRAGDDSEEAPALFEELMALEAARRALAEMD